MTQLALPLDLVACNVCATTCGRPTATAAKPGTIVTWRADEPGPYDPPGPGRPHPVDNVDAAADSWPCPHCSGDAPYNHRDTCAHNELRPPDCRCAWCTYGLTWASCPRPGCGRRAHTTAPSRPDLVVCTTHGHQQIATPLVDKLQALSARPPSTAVGVA